MVCLGNMCMDTLHKGDNDDDNDDNDDDDDDNNNNNNNNRTCSSLYSNTFSCQYPGSIRVR